MGGLAHSLGEANRNSEKGRKENDADTWFPF